LGSSVLGVSRQALAKKSAARGGLRSSSTLFNAGGQILERKQPVIQAVDYGVAVLEPASVVGVPLWAAFRLIAS
jgi:hypothetical protein